MILDDLECRTGYPRQLSAQQSIDLYELVIGRHRSSSSSHHCSNRVSVQELHSASSRQAVSVATASPRREFVQQSEYQIACIVLASVDGDHWYVVVRDRAKPRSPRKELD